MQAPQLQATYEKCPKHPSNDIILFCLGGQCIEPLCKQCCKEHVQWHNSLGTKADIDTVDNVRQNCLNDVHSIKVRFEEERAILKHFSDSEQSELIRSAHEKLEEVKRKLQTMINEYCASLEAQIKLKVQQHRAAHPGEKKDLHHRLNAVISQLDSEEKSLLQPKYLRALLIVLTQEKNHDLEGFANEIDAAVKHYLSNMFDVFVHEDHLQKLKFDLQGYVAVEEARLDTELEIYTNKIRSGEQVYGMDRQGNPKNPKDKNSRAVPLAAFESRAPAIFENRDQPPSSGWKPSAIDPYSRYNPSPQKSSVQGPPRQQSGISDMRESNNARLKSKYDL